MLLRFVKFGAVGATGAIVNFLIFYLTLDIFRNVQITASFSFLFAVTNNFFLNKKWTFNYDVEGNNQNTLIKLWFKFVLASFFGLLVNLIVLTILHDVFNYSPYISQIIGLGMGFLFNFYFSSKIFKK